ncbi:ZBTB38 [Mytilus coruscus]|uniref:ZBTB38 n=1 Tax=Mytilus coruscus TaxID=42192 RepID=A0A6J8AMS1_MYTCO|nr:ZBTB38 [Mytilus coruscus]
MDTPRIKRRSSYMVSVPSENVEVQDRVDGAGDGGKVDSGWKPYYSEEMPDQHQGTSVRSNPGHTHILFGHQGQESDVVGPEQTSQTNECDPTDMVSHQAQLNAWDSEKSRRVLFSTLRGQAETFAYGLQLVFQRNYDRLKQKMEERFGHTAMKVKYTAEAKLRTRKAGESLRDFGQALQDLYRRAYPGNPDIVEENAIKAF